MVILAYIIFQWSLDKIAGNRLEQIDHLHMTTFHVQEVLCLIDQEQFISYWSGKTVDFICIYRDEPSLFMIKFMPSRRTDYYFLGGDAILKLPLIAPS